MTSREDLYRLIDAIPESEADDVKGFLVALLRKTGKTGPLETSADRQQRLQALNEIRSGKYKNAFSPVDLFLQEKRAETEREDRHGES